MLQDLAWTVALLGLLWLCNRYASVDTAGLIATAPLLALAYVLNPLLHQTALEEFHEIMLAAPLLGLATRPAGAQQGQQAPWPNRPLRMVIPWPPGQ